MKWKALVDSLFGVQMSIQYLIVNWTQLPFKKIEINNPSVKIMKVIEKMYLILHNFYFRKLSKSKWYFSKLEILMQQKIVSKQMCSLKQNGENHYLMGVYLDLKI